MQTIGKAIVVICDLSSQVLSLGRMFTPKLFFFPCTSIFSRMLTFRAIINWIISDCWFDVGILLVHIFYIAVVTPNIGVGECSNSYQRWLAVDAVIGPPSVGCLWMQWKVNPPPHAFIGGLSLDCTLTLPSPRGQDFACIVSASQYCSFSAGCCAQSKTFSLVRNCQILSQILFLCVTIVAITLLPVLKRPVNPEQ